MNLVPVKRVSDGVLGVYDTVRSSFYTNVGSGTFQGVPAAKAFWTNAGGDGDINNAANWNCTDADGETVVGARTNALNATSSFGSGAKTLSFASGATVTVDLSKRTDNLRQFAKSADPFLIVWTTVPDDSVKFIIDEETKRKGFKVKPRTIEIPVEGSDTPVTKSGLALVNAGAFVLFVR